MLRINIYEKLYVCVVILGILAFVLSCPAVHAEQEESEKELNGFVQDIYAETEQFSFDINTMEYSLVVTDTQNLLFRVVRSEEEIEGGLWTTLYVDGIAVDVSGQTSTGYYSYQSQLLGEKSTISTRVLWNRWFPVGETHVLTIRVGERKDKTTTLEPDNFLRSDSYHFRITRVPGLKELDILSEEGSVVSYPNIKDNYEETSFYGVTQDGSIKLNLEAKTEGVSIFVNGEPYHQEEDYLLSDFRSDDTKLAIIPITLKFPMADGNIQREYILYVSDTDYRPVIKEQSEETVYIKNDEQKTLFIKEKKPQVGEISYQWYYSKAGFKKRIIGATESTFIPKTPDIYQCIVTNTVNGISYRTESNKITYTWDPDILRAPAFVVQPYTSMMKYSFYSGDTPVILAQLEDSAELGKNGYIQGIEYKVAVFCTNSPEPVNGIKIGESYRGGMEKGILYVGIIPNQDIEGDAYYYMTATVSREGEEPQTSTSECLHLNFRSSSSLVTGLEGNGTDSDPYLVHDEDDLVYIKDLVEGTDNSGRNPEKTLYALNGLLFRFTGDITLSEGWEPIGGLIPGGPMSQEGVLGGNGSDLLPFSGIIDGGGHTLTIADHGKPLLNFGRRAKIRNISLQGDHIDGYGFVDRYTVDYQPEGYLYDPGRHWLVDFDHVTIKSGTKILKSGFIGGYASGENAVNIRNCTIEEGVVVGYDRTQSNIGSFGGEFNGTITDSVSYADVYGVNTVGGLIGTKGQSMGPCRVANSSFRGTITATGERVGGIAGSGYIAGGAPNTPTVDVENCYVDAVISGKDKVGGIIGDESGKKVYNEEGDIYGVRGALSICDNFFYGQLISEGPNVGGTTGYLNDFEKDTGEASNFFLEGCGATRGIGGTKTGEVTGEEKYSTSATAEEFADGTVLSRLNQSPTSYKNWTQGEKYPVQSDEPVILSLSLSGGYKTEYYLGEEIDLAGMEISANWNNGDVTPLTASDVTVSGYDPGKRGTQTVTLTMKERAAKARFNVTVLKRPAEGEDIQVSFTLLGDSVHDSDTDGTIHTLANGNLTEWIPEGKYTVDINATVKDVFEEACMERGISWANPTGNYIETITYKGATIGEFTNGKDSGWMYTLNGSHPALGVSEQYLEDGDVIVFHYTDCYTREKDAEKWKEEMDQKLEELANQINALPDPDRLTLSEEDREAVEEAVKAYEALNDGEKKLLPGEVKDRLEKVRAGLAELEKGASSGGDPGQAVPDKPGPATNLAVSCDLSGKKLTLKFDKAAGASFYRISYKTDKAKKWKTVTTAGTGYVFTKMKKNATLEVKVQAVAKAGGKETVGAWTAVNCFLQNTARIRKAAPGKRSAKVAWKKTAGVTGFQISYSPDKAFKKQGLKLAKGTKKTSLTIKKLKAKKKYFIRIRPYKTVKGKKYFGAWSAVKSVKTK